MTGPEPGDLAEIEVSFGPQKDRQRAFRRHGGEWITEFGGIYRDDQVRVVRPLSVVPTDSLEARIAATLRIHLPLRKSVTEIAAAVRSAITKPTTED